MTVLGLSSIRGQASEFTINSIDLQALPATKLRNGDKLELKCVVKFAKTTDFVLNSTITFYTDDKKIYTTSSTEDHVSHTIPAVRASHTGQYKCEVSVASRIKTSEDVRIEVTGLSSPLISVSKNQTSEGEKVTVRCEAPEEWQHKKFKFYKINQKNAQETKEILTSNNYHEVAFMIKEGDEFLRFKCDVQLLITQETSPLSAIKTVTVVAPFSIPRIDVLPSFNFTEGANMTVKCAVQEGRTRAGDMKLTLQKDGHIINSSTTNTLSYFRVATVDDMGNYTCKAESEKTSKSSSVKIDIAELFPRPHLTLERRRKNPYIQENEDITLKCSVNVSDPETLLYKFILNEGEKQFGRKGGKFFITASTRYSGSYVCQVTILDITKKSDPLDVHVYAPVKNPVLTHIMRSNKTVVLGDTLELTCKCQSGTPPITYSLLRGNELLETKTMDGDKEAQFLVNSSKSHDLGQYKCQATNRNTQSTGKYSNIVNVTVIIPISSVRLTTIPDSGDVEEGSEMSLICQVEDGTLPIRFLFYRKKGNENLVKNMTETKDLYAIYRVSKFSKQEDGGYFCVASNGAHKEVRSNTSDVRAVLATWKKAVIGTFVLLIILAAIGICAYLHTDKKKKGADISKEKSRSSKPVTTNNEKPAVEMKAGEAYFDSVKNEEELHILKTSEENTGNNQQNHEMEHTEADGTSPDAHQDAADSNVIRTEDASEADSHP